MSAGGVMRGARGVVQDYVLVYIKVCGCSLLCTREHKSERVLIIVYGWERLIGTLLSTRRVEHVLLCRELDELCDRVPLQRGITFLA